MATLVFFDSKYTKLAILYQIILLQMSNQFNVSLFPWSKYTNEERQPVPWLILFFLLGGLCQKHAMYKRRCTKLAILYQVILLQNVQSLQCSLFPWSKYTNEERQPVPWFILNFLRKLLSETCHLHKDISHGDTLNWPLSIKLFCF